MTDMTVATTIYHQLGGKRFVVMTGAKNFVASNNSLSFHIGRNAKQINGVLVVLNGSDFYDIEFLKFRKYQEPIVADSAENIYFDQLEEVIKRHTGLETRLF